MRKVKSLVIYVYSLSLYDNFSVGFNNTMIIYTLYKHYYCIVFLFVINYNICRHIYSYLCHACLRVSVCVFYGKVCWNLPFGEIILVIRFCFIFVNIPEKYPFVLLMTKTYKLIAFTSKKDKLFLSFNEI